ncbi:acyl-CoA dehydrogenase family protein [Agromyces sp. LHK192]|uniref:acyl-CoA dehydrogenase family protein n=1 Tax=Agromyces sp. LHK192 TaxID=2498704 RepID=UPI000FDB0CA3|nr:acyl-CoA dehydrogenase family protein [Agromyces sp. LHK192]
MTAAAPVTGTGLAAVRARFAPLFEAIAAAAPVHEREGTRPHREVAELAAAGFGALRIPTELGGAGLGVEDFFALLVDLAAADSNQPQLWRNHIAFVEDRLAGGTDDDQRRLRRIARGDVIGGAWSEVGSAGILGDTRLERVDGTLRLNGTKYYSTGSLFADEIGVFALDEAGDARIALVDATAEGVELRDDWTGFGQRATGSGTTVLRDVVVADEDVLPFAERSPVQEAVYQLVLVATLAGIGRAARDDVIGRVRARTRTHVHANATVAADDVQVQQVVGRVAALAASAEGSVGRAARALDEAIRAEEAAATAAARAAAIAVYEAQVSVAPAVLEASALLFDALGSSGVQRDAALDRHWRNARTVASHNPLVYKERVLGDWYLNAADPLAIFSTALQGAADAPGPADDAAREGDRA